VRITHIKSQLEEVFGDIRATWRTAKNLLHSVDSELFITECADLVNKFSDFFTDKVRRIRDNISTALHNCKQSVSALTVRHQTAVVGLSAGDNRRGSEAADLDAVQDIAARRPAMSLAQGLRRCLHTSHHQTHQRVAIGWNVPGTFQVGPSAARCRFSRRQGSTDRRRTIVLLLLLVTFQCVKYFLGYYPRPKLKSGAV